MTRLLSIIAALIATISAQAAGPAVEAALALPRTEPRHYVETALALIDFGAQAEAEAVADEFIALSLEDEALVSLVDAVGSARLSRLGRSLPRTSALVNRALDAAFEAANSPERLQSLVDRLSGDRDDAIAAIRSLRQTGAPGVVFCLDQIASSDDPKQRARLREALVALDPISQPALFEAVGSANAKVRAEAAYALGRLAELNRLRSGIAPALVAAGALTGPLGDPVGDASRWAYHQLTGSLPTVPSVTARLDAAIKELLDGQLLFAADADREPGAGPTDLAMRLAENLARARRDLDPSSESAARRLALILMENDSEDFIDAPARMFESVLADALDQGFYVAATRCCAELGRIGEVASVLSVDGSPAALVAALDATHPAVRQAAAAAILAIDPQQPFAGSSRLIETLEYLASATGDQVAPVGSPQLARAAQTAGWLLGSGFAATPANRGSTLVDLATRSADTQFVLIDMSISLPGVREVVFRLRRDAATALTPIAILAPEGRLYEAERVARDHGGAAGRVVVVSRPHSIDATASLAERLVAMQPGGWPDAATRATQAEEAAAALASLIAEGPSFYGLDRRAVAAVRLPGGTAE